MKFRFDILDFCLVISLFVVIASGGLAFSGNFSDFFHTQTAQVGGNTGSQTDRSTAVKNYPTYQTTKITPVKNYQNYQTTQTKTYNDSRSPSNGNIGSPEGNIPTSGGAKPSGTQSQRSTGNTGSPAGNVDVPQNRQSVSGAASCYSFTPAYDYPGPIINIDVTGGGQKKTVSIVNQNPPSLLQPIYLSAKLRPNGQPVCPLVLGFKADFFFSVGVTRIPFADTPFLFLDPVTRTPILYPDFMTNFKYFGISDIGGKTAQEKINNEDAIIGAIDKDHSIAFSAITFGRPAVFQNMSAPATNCAKLSGTGPKKIVFMRGNGWNSSANDFLYQASAVRDQFLATDPFKKYASQFSFYADLKKQDQGMPLSTNASDQVRVAAVKSQSSCGADAFAYTYFFLNPPRPAIAWDSHSVQNIAFIHSSVARQASPDFVLTSIHELGGHAIGGLNDEYKDYDFPVGTFSNPLTNCSLDPFKDYRNQVDNHIYGAPDIKRCKYESDPAGKVYYRPNDNSVMNMTGGRFSQLITSSKTNVISCMHIVLKIKGETLTKTNAFKYGPECLKMDTAKDGIPPVVAAPKINKISQVTVTHDSTENSTSYKNNQFIAITQGSKVSIQGTGFTQSGNTVQFVSKADADEIYEITNLPFDYSDILVFVVPNDIPVGEYFIKVGALNSDWSNTRDIKIHGGAPSNLIARAVKKGQIDLSWIDNSSDESSFVIYRFSGEPALVTGEMADLDELVNAYPPNVSNHSYTVDDTDGVKMVIIPIGANLTSHIDKVSLDALENYKYLIKAKFDDGLYSLSSNVANITSLPKPKAPVLSVLATSDSTILLSWTVSDTDIEEYSIFQEPSAVGITQKPTSKSYVAEDLDPGTEYCYFVSASAGNMFSDKSNTACATTLELGGVLSLQDESLSSVTGDASFSFNPDLKNISSIDLVAGDGKVIASDQSAPWNFQFDSTMLPNGPHNIYAVVKLPPPPGGSGKIFTTKPIVITVVNPVKSVTPTSSVLSISFENSLKAPSKIVSVYAPVTLGGFTAKTSGESISVKNLSFRLNISGRGGSLADVSGIGLYNSNGVFVVGGTKDYKDEDKIIFKDAFTVVGATDYTIRAILGQRFKRGQTFKLWANFYKDDVVFTGVKSGKNVRAPRKILNLSRMTVRP